jgi:hypothetical protein
MYSDGLIWTGRDEIVASGLPASSDGMMGGGGASTLSAIFAGLSVTDAEARWDEF